jgi:hypothetical protein
LVGFFDELIIDQVIGEIDLVKTNGKTVDALEIFAGTVVTQEIIAILSHPYSLLMDVCRSTLLPTPYESACHPDWDLTRPSGFAFYPFSTLFTILFSGPKW